MRQPNTWGLEHSRLIQTGLTIAAAGGMSLFTFDSKLMHTTGLVLLVTSFFAWAYHSHITRPKLADYIEFLETEIEETTPGFIKATQEAFKDIWQIDDMVEVFD